MASLQKAGSHIQGKAEKNDSRSNGAKEKKVIGEPIRDSLCRSDGYGRYVA